MPGSARSPASPTWFRSACSGGGVERRAFQPARRVDRGAPAGRRLRARLSLPFNGTWWVFSADQRSGRTITSSLLTSAMRTTRRLAVRPRIVVPERRIRTTGRGEGPCSTPATDQVVEAVDGVRDNRHQVQSKPAGSCGGHVISTSATASRAAGSLSRGRVRVRVGAASGRGVLGSPATPGHVGAAPALPCAGSAGAVRLCVAGCPSRSATTSQQSANGAPNASPGSVHPDELSRLSTVGSPLRCAGPHLAPRAVRGILVRPEAQQPRAVAEAVALHLVVAHLGDELRPHRRLLELAAAPAVRLREAALRRVLEQRLHAREDLVVALRADRGRADVVDLAVVVVEPEQQRREVLGFAFQRTPTTTQSAVLYVLDLRRPRRASPGRYGTPSRLAMTPSRPAASNVSSQLAGASAVARGRREVGSPCRPARGSSRAAPRAGSSCTGSPSQSSTSKAMKSAGISAESLRTRLSAGWSRICIESKSSTPSRAITISPSSAEWGGSRSPSGRSSGK